MNFSFEISVPSIFYSFHLFISRVAELEQENARLLALANQSKPEAQQDDLVSEVELLRRQLAEAQERERELNEELSRKEAAASQPVKMEMMDDSPLPSRSGSVQPQMKSSASLGLMVSLTRIVCIASVLNIGNL